MIRERFCTSKNESSCPGVDADGIQTETKRCETEECNGKSPILYCNVFSSSALLGIRELETELP